MNTKGGMSELFVDSANDERDTISLIKQTRQEKNDEVVCLSRTRRRKSARNW